MSTNAAAPPLPAVQRMAQMITGGIWITNALHTAASLRLADLLGAGPQTAMELGDSAGADAGSVYRVLRALASVGVFAEDDEGRFDLTPLAETLRADAPGSLRAMALLFGEPRHLHVWASFLDGVRTGEVPCRLATGSGLFDWLSREPDLLELFEQSMTSFSGFEAQAAVDVYDFSGLRTVVDVGGGSGQLLATVLRANPGLSGVLLELPDVAAGAPELLRRHDVFDRVRVVEGDFLESVPAGDAYLLKHILHDWDDEAAVAILRNCRRAMHPGGRVLVVQEALPGGNAPSAGKLLDIQMLLIGGRERAADEFADLFRAAGMRLSRVVETACPLHIIEGLPA
jgi:hypothetical protein